MPIKTITLKLHNPSKRKRQIIDQAMLNYSRAYQYLLDKAHAQIEEIRRDYKDNKGNYRAINIAKWVDKELSKELNQFHVQPFKDALKIDFGMTLASYLSLNEIRQDANYPIAYLSDRDLEKSYNDAINGLENGSKTLDECEREIKKIVKKNNVLKPLFFCRYAANRDYCLLYDAKNNRYYAKLYLMNVKDEKRKEINSNNEIELRYIHKDSNILESSGRKERFILVPLSFGQWQEQYLKKALDTPEILKTARLIKKKGDYYLSISVDTGEAEKIKTDTFLGIGRALKSPVHYTIVDNRSNIISDGAIVTKAVSESRNNPVTIQELHKIANAIVDIAYQERSQVVMKSLIDKGDKLQWIDENKEQYMPILNCHSYNQLARILEYKLRGKGLPPPIKVSPIGIYYTCPECGLHTRRNRFSKDMFICVACGTTLDIESLGSLNLARKLNRHSKGTLKIKVEKTSKGIKFTNKILGLEFHPSDPHNCMDEFSTEIKRIIQDFYGNISSNARNKEFMKKYSLIKKLEEAEDLNELIQII
ncbi:zinc ribbon domain-containing protein [Petroclostridium xylanilyticum]|jgi:putative transposase|uniref:zinc ribbon domain-containing protein n=1 Tax=Petroclostridium xylanilyticum TaxID=1792311 RepID=UPI000B99A7C7|nr:zinc ribbon domain-containing protein [Petroclostridium xylanilyticum]